MLREESAPKGPSNSVAGDVSKAHMGDCCRKVKVGDKSPRNRAGRCTTFRRGTAREIGCGRGDLLFAERGCNHYGVGCEGRFRSEEHTSELQSLMRISYAVFCLK